MGRVPAWRKFLSLAFLGGLVILAFALIPGAGTRGGLAWWQEPLWRNVLLYAVMVSGMMFRVVWDQVENWRQRNAQPGARRARRPRFDFWEFVYPVMPSVALFQAVLWLAENKELSLQLGLASFQNGFFWHAVLVRIKESAGAKP